VINISFSIKVLTKFGKSGRVKTSPPQKRIDLRFKKYDL